jgi:replicative DNA helicase
MELFSHTAEQVIVGKILLDNNLLDELEIYADLEDLHGKQTKHTLEAMKRLTERDNGFTFTSICEHYANKPEFIKFLTHCQQISYANDFKQCALTIRERADMRRLVEAANKVLETCYNPEMSFKSKLEISQDAMLNAVEQKNDTIKDSKQQLQILINDLEAKSQSKGVIGLKTPWNNLNEQIITSKKGELVTVAGRPGSGKTNFAVNWFSHQIKNKQSAIYFSLEMTTDELLCRLAADWSNTYYSKFHDANFQQDDWSRITGLGAIYKDLKTYIDDSSVQTISTIRAKCRRIKKTHGLDFIVIDHVGLMEHGYKDNETAGLSKISKELKRLAKDLGIVVVMLSQLNRSCEQRTNKRPMMSDLRQSGSIEQDSDTVLLLYRDDYYNEDSQNKGIAEINAAKVRKGRTGTVLLKTEFEMCRFVDTDHVFIEEQKHDLAKGMRF